MGSSSDGSSCSPWENLMGKSYVRAIWLAIRGWEKIGHLTVEAWTTTLDDMSDAIWWQSKKSLVMSWLMSSMIPLTKCSRLLVLRKKLGCDERGIFDGGNFA